MDINEYQETSGRILKEDSTVVNQADIMEENTGKYSQALTGTSAITATTDYYIFCIVPSSAMVIASQTDVVGAVNADLTAIASHPVGVPFYTNLTALTLTSGDGMAYLKKV